MPHDLKVYICPECGEQECCEQGPARWTRDAHGNVEHYHPGEKPHWPGHRCPAVPVQVFTGDQVRERLGAEAASEEAIRPARSIFFHRARALRDAAAAFPTTKETR